MASVDSAQSLRSTESSRSSTIFAKNNVRPLPPPPLDGRAGAGTLSLPSSPEGEGGEWSSSSASEGRIRDRSPVPASGGGAKRSEAIHQRCPSTRCAGWFETLS